VTCALIRASEGLLPEREARGLSLISGSTVLMGPGSRVSRVPTRSIRCCSEPGQGSGFGDFVLSDFNDGE